MAVRLPGHPHTVHEQTDSGRSGVQQFDRLRGHSATQPASFKLDGDVL